MPLTVARASRRRRYGQLQTHAPEQFTQMEFTTSVADDAGRMHPSVGLHLPVAKLRVACQHGPLESNYYLKTITYINLYIDSRPTETPPKEVKDRTADGGRSSTDSHAGSIESGRLHYASPCLKAGSPPCWLTVCGPCSGPRNLHGHRTAVGASISRFRRRPSGETRPGIVLRKLGRTRCRAGTRRRPPLA